MSVEDYRFPYAGETTDSEPLCYVLMSEAFLKFIRGLASSLLDNEIWGTLDDSDAATFQAIDALARLGGDEVANLAQPDYDRFYPALAFEWQLEPGVVFTVDTLQVLNLIGAPVSPANGIIVFRLQPFFAVGNYVLSLYGKKRSFSGKFTWLLDGDDLAPEDPFDWYNATPLRNEVHMVAFSIESAGFHTLDYKCVGKNASSSDFDCAVTGACIRQTG
jgi:hypothetical protein